MFNKTVCGEAEEHCVDPESGSIPHRTRILKRVLKEKIQYFVLALLWYAFHFQFFKERRGTSCVFAASRKGCFLLVGIFNETETSETIPAIAVFVLLLQQICM